MSNATSCCKGYLRLEKAVKEAEDEGIGSGEERDRAAAFVEKQRIEEAPVGVVDKEWEKVQGFGVESKGDEGSEGKEKGRQLLDEPGKRRRELDGRQSIHQRKACCLL